MTEDTIGAEAIEDHRNVPLSELSNGWATTQRPNPVFREINRKRGPVFEQGSVCWAGSDISEN